MKDSPKLQVRFFFCALTTVCSIFYTARVILRRSNHIGADEFEQLVITTVSRELSLQGPTAASVPGIWSKEERDLIHRYVERVVVQVNDVKIVLQREVTGATNSASLRENNEELRILCVALPLRRQRDRKEILVPNNSGLSPHRLDRSLVIAVARGWAWVQALRRGEYANTAEIAAKFELSEPYVRRILRLAFLAPDIVEAIAEGRQPRALTLERLLCPLPLSWIEQRRALGFSE